MDNIKLKKGYTAGVMAMLLTVAAIGLPAAYGADSIDTTAECSLTLEVGDGNQFHETLSAMTLQASLYQVADISETGFYTTKEGYEELNLADIDSTTSAATWQETAEAADSIVETNQLKADYTMEMAGGAGTVSGIAQGMYLVKVAEAEDVMYEYSFMPFLISVPNNQFYQTGDDQWIYDVTADIKPEQTSRLGAVEITKTLSAHNANLGTAMFVFQIEAADVDGEIVYSNVAGLSFDAAGTKSVRIDGIPAGSTVTVTEVYSGSSYEIASGAPSQSIVVAADEIQNIAFVNNYNDQLVSGTGTVNHFDKDDTDVQNNGWRWEQRPLSESSVLTAADDSTSEAESESETEETAQISQE